MSRAVKRLGTYILLKGAASAASSPLSYSNSSSASKVVPSNSNATADQENTDGCKDSEEDKEADWDGEDWQDFRMADMLSEMREYFRDGDMDGAILIWRRHHIDMGGLLDYNNNNNIVGGGRRHHQSVLTALLREIPVWVGAAKFVSWLRDEVVPFITHHEEM